MLSPLISKFVFLGFSVIAGIHTLNYFYSVLPVNTVVLFLYTIAVFSASIWITFAMLHSILNNKKVYSKESNFIIHILHNVLTFEDQKSKENPVPLDDRIKTFSNDVERQFLQNWYSSYISKDEAFLTASNQLLDTIIRRALQVSSHVDSDKIIQGILIILLRHVREFKKAAKKSGSVEINYRYAHAASRNNEIYERFMLQLSLHLLRHFIHWELYNSVASQTLSAILARKLFAYGAHYISRPAVLNALIYNGVKKTDYDFITFPSTDCNEQDVHHETKPAVKPIEKETVATKPDESVVSEPVTVFEAHTSKKSKTWRNSTDLDCISLGHDILFLSDIAEDTTDGKTTAATSKPKANPMKTSTIAHNIVKDTMKDIQQSTANTTIAMKHKIEDLQDEAAGMVEGILDIGMAGLRKGLRLTGLQDNVMEARPRSESRQIPKQRLIKTGHVESASEEDKLPCAEASEDVLYEGDILLEKSPDMVVVPKMEIEPSSDSPEYEDNTDLATTTAKLRSLLAQRTEFNTPVTTSPLSSLVPTPQDISCGSMEDLTEVDGALPSMYKYWAKTATGVFQNTLNTIKTALPGTAGPDVELSGGEDRHWTFVEDQKHEFGSILGKFVAERQVFCTVENAYEAIEAIKLTDQVDSTNVQNHFDEDDLDEFEIQIPMTKALVDLLCELTKDTFAVLVKENVLKMILLCTGSAIEEQLHKLGVRCLQFLTENIGNLPKFRSEKKNEVMELDDFLKDIFSDLPNLFEIAIPKEDLAKILRILIESLQSYKINSDIILQVFEVCASEVIKGCNELSPA